MTTDFYMFKDHHKPTNTGRHQAALEKRAELSYDRSLHMQQTKTVQSAAADIKPDPEPETVANTQPQQVCVTDSEPYIVPIHGSTLAKPIPTSQQDTSEPHLITRHSIPKFSYTPQEKSVAPTTTIVHQPTVTETVVASDTPIVTATAPATATATTILPPVSITEDEIVYDIPGTGIMEEDGVIPTPIPTKTTVTPTAAVPTIVVEEEGMPIEMPRIVDEDGNVVEYKFVEPDTQTRSRERSRSHPRSRSRSHSKSKGNSNSEGDYDEHGRLRTKLHTVKEELKSELHEIREQFHETIQEIKNEFHESKQKSKQGVRSKRTHVKEGVENKLDEEAPAPISRISNVSLAKSIDDLSDNSIVFWDEIDSAALENVVAHPTSDLLSNNDDSDNLKDLRQKNSSIQHLDEFMEAQEASISVPSDITIESDTDTVRTESLQSLVDDASNAFALAHNDPSSDEEIDNNYM